METDERNRHLEGTEQQARSQASSARSGGGALRNRRRSQEAGTHTGVAPEEREATTEPRADRAVPRDFTRPEGPESRGRELEEPIEYFDEPNDYEDYDEEEELASRGRRVWVPVVMLILVVLILAGAIYNYTGVFSRPDRVWPGAQEAETPRAEVAGAAADAIPQDRGVAVHESGLAFSQTKSGEEVSVRNGEKTWEGTATAEGRGELIRLEGPTAGEFKSGFDTPEGSVTFGTFASYEPATGKLEHATLHRLMVGEGTDAEEITEGSYYVVEDGHRFSGTYVDERPGGGKKVVRSYTLRRSDEVERCFEVTFEAELGTLIPDLVDWREGLDAPKCG